VARAQTPPTVPTFPSTVELITVDAVVVDAQGHPVSGLTRDDFVVKEDGRPQEVVGFEAFAPGPESKAGAAASGTQAPGALAPHGGSAFAILLDDLRIAPTRAGEARRAAQLFLERSLRAGDEITLGSTSGDAWWSARLPQGREDLLAVLGRVKGRYVESTSLDRMTDYEAFWINAHEDAPAPGRLLPDRPDSAPATAPTPDPNPGRSSLKERVKQRWKDANLCTGTSCDGMVRSRAADLDMARRNRTRLTLTALHRGVDSLAPARGRKSLVFLSEGFLEDSAPELRAVMAAAREANTAVYFIDVRGLVALPGGGSAADPEARVEGGERMTSGFEGIVQEAAGASSLADQTGGFSVRNTNDFAAGAARIAEESRVYYLLGFYPPEGKATSKWRNLRVEVKKPGLTVRARRGYTLHPAGALAQAQADKKRSKLSLEPAIARALDSAHDAPGIPLRTMAYVFEPRPKETTRVVVVAEFDASRLGSAAAGKAHGGRLDVSVVATQRDSGQEQRADERATVTVAQGEAPAWRGLAREFELPAGVAQVRVVVLDPSSGALGSTTQRLEIPPPGVLRLATPILTDRLESGSEKEAHPRPALSVHRGFAPEGRLYCQLEVFGAARPEGAPPRVSAGLVVRNAEGKVVLQAAPTPIAPDANGRVVRLLGLPLDGLAEGAYELVLDVQDEVGGSRLERREAFTVAKALASP